MTTPDTPNSEEADAERVEIAARAGFAAGMASLGSHWLIEGFDAIDPFTRDWYRSIAVAVLATVAAKQERIDEHAALKRAQGAIYQARRLLCDLERYSVRMHPAVIHRRIEEIASLLWDAWNDAERALGAVAPTAAADDIRPRERRCAAVDGIEEADGSCFCGDR